MLKTYEGFLDFFKRKERNEIYLDDIKDCYADLDFFDVKDDLINGDNLNKSLFPYPFREDDMDKTYREFLDDLNFRALYPDSNSLIIDDNYIVFHLQFIENPEIEKYIIESSERVKKLFDCKVKIFRRSVIHSKYPEKINEHFLTILIKSKSKIII